MSGPSVQGYELTPRVNPVDTTGAAQFDTWRSQSAWYIDPTNGDDANSGLTALAAIQTWAELRRRMNGGPQLDSFIYLLGNLPAGDPMIFDWELYLRTTVVEVSGFLGVAVSHTGSYTGVPVARDPLTNTFNKVIDAGVADWTPYMVGTRNLIVPTSGAAANCPAWLFKTAGADVLASTYANFDIGVDVQPAQNDTYEIWNLPLVVNYVIQPRGSGQLYFRYLAIGDDTTSSFYSISPSPSVLTEFYYCQMTDASPPALYNGWLLQAPVPIGVSVDLVAGGCSDVYTWNDLSETEEGGQLILSYGFVSMGLRIQSINGGYVRVYEAAFIDSAGSALSVASGACLRVEQAWGSGNTAYGVYIGGAGKLALNSGDLSNVTGTSGDVSLNGVVKTWANIAAANDYIADTTSSAVITPAT